MNYPSRCTAKSGVHRSASAAARCPQCRVRPVATATRVDLPPTSRSDASEPTSLGVTNTFSGIGDFPVEELKDSQWASATFENCGFTAPAWSNRFPVKLSPPGASFKGCKFEGPPGVIFEFDNCAVADSVVFGNAVVNQGAVLRGVEVTAADGSTPELRAKEGSVAVVVAGSPGLKVVASPGARVSVRASDPDSLVVVTVESLDPSDPAVVKLSAGGVVCAPAPTDNGGVRLIGPQSQVARCGEECRGDHALALAKLRVARNTAATRNPLAANNDQAWAFLLEGGLLDLQTPSTLDSLGDEAIGLALMLGGPNP